MNVLKYLDIKNLELRKRLVALFFASVLLAVATDSVTSFVWLALLMVFWAAVVEDNENTEGSFFSQMEKRLLVLDPVHAYEFLSFDVDIIDVLFSVSDFEKYSRDAWKATVASMNNFFRLVDDFVNKGDSLVLVEETFEALVSEYMDVVSNFHSFVYVLPRYSVYREKFNAAFVEIKLVLLKYLNEIAESHGISRAIEDPVSFLDYQNHSDNVFFAS